MGYTVAKLMQGQTVTIVFEHAVRVDVKQNHLFLYDKDGEVIGIYQSGWWTDCLKIRK